MAESKVLYAAYGEMAMVLPELLGRDVGPGRFAVLQAVELGAQSFCDVPDTVHPDAPAPISPQQILSDNWGENFKAYVARPSEDSTKETPARIFEVTAEERSLILEEWNLASFGWFQDYEALAQPLSGAALKVRTDVIDVSGVLEPVNSYGYATQPPLNGDKTAGVAKIVRQAYLERVLAEGVESGDVEACRTVFARRLGVDLADVDDSVVRFHALNGGFDEMVPQAPARATLLGRLGLNQNIAYHTSRS